MENMRELADERLVELYAKGNNDAFDVLLSRYQDKLYSYIYFIVHNEDLANDLFQDTFVKAIVRIQQGKYVESGRFFAWLVRIAHNLVVDSYRQEKSENWISNEDASGGDLFNRIDLCEMNIEMELVSQQSLKDVAKLVEELPENQREVIYMRFYQDLSFKEIAEITGVSINTALGRVRYALLNLRQIIRERKISLAVY